MSKLTLHDKVREGFFAACALKKFANALERCAEDFGWIEAKTIAKEAKKEAEEYIKKLN